MSEDFVVNVRQISQYAPIGVPAATDLLLLQQGGLGGPYRSLPYGALLTGLDSASFGLRPPPGLRGVASSFLTTPLGARQGFNWYVDPNGITRYLQNGVAGIWSFADTELSFSITPTGFKDAVIPNAMPLLQLGFSGQLQIAQQLAVGRAPGRPNEVVTLEFLQRNAVVSFNGRTGEITLSNADIASALGTDPCDPVATQGWVNNAICQALHDWYYTTPLVFSFNGRTGTICLTATDVSAALMSDPLNSRAPSPAFGDASTRIATTLFVDESVQTLQDWIVQQNFAFAETLQLYAPLNSPNFTGYPQAPTAPIGTSTGQLATTAFVMNAVAESTTGVSSFNTRTGAVVLDQADIIDASGWDSVALTGAPTAPTPPIGSNGTQVATCAWVLEEISAMTAGVASFNTRTGDVTLTLADITGAGGAPINNTGLTGIPTAPTAAPGTATTQLATTAFVSAAVGATVTSFNGRNGAVNLTSGDISGAGGAPAASPAFTGTPTAPTAAPGTSSTQIATTAYVAAAIAAGGGVSTFNTRAGAVTLTAVDVINTNYVGSGFVNKFTNGSFQVGQRGGGPSAIGTYTVDGWIVVGPTTTTWQQVINANFRGTALRLTSTAVASVSLLSRLESLTARQLFASDGTPQAVTVQYKVFNNGAVALNNPTITGYTPPSTDSWGTANQVFSSSTPTPIPPGARAIIAYTFMMTPAMQAGLQLTITFDVSSGYIDIAEADVRATPWAAVGWNANPPRAEVLDIQAELARCWRYFQIYNNVSGAYYSNYGAGSWQPFSIPPMRATPTVGFQMTQTNADTNGVFAQDHTNLRIEAYNSTVSTPVSYQVNIQCSAEL